MKDTILAWKLQQANKRRIACRIGDLGYIDSKHARVIHIIPRKPSGDRLKFQTVGQTLCGIPIAMIQLDGFGYMGNYVPCARCAVSWNHNPSKKKKDRLVRTISAKSSKGIYHHWIGGMRTMCGKKIKNETWQMGNLRPAFADGPALAPVRDSNLCLKCQKSRK